MASPSGTTTFSPAFSDILLDVFSRIQIRPSEITADHMWQAKMSANLMLAEWEVRNGPNLWKMEEVTVPLQQGVSSYTLPSTTVGILDYFIRQYQLTNTANIPVSLTTSAGFTNVTVVWPNHGLVPSSWISFVTPISIGGLTIYGTYQVLAVIDINTFIITSVYAASTSVSGGGAVPVFTSSYGSTTINVNFANHGLVAGQTFAIGVATSVGGVPLSGAYNVASVIDINNFTIVAAQAGASATVAENSGLAQIQSQSVAVSPLDKVINPISRSEYSAIPNKTDQGFPTSIWFNRQITPVVNLWYAPDSNGPYVLHMWCLVQTNDITTPGGVGLDVPWRFLEAFAQGMAAKLAVKFPPKAPNTIDLQIKLAEQSWSFASQQDTEGAPMYVTPMLNSYFR